MNKTLTAIAMSSLLLAAPLSAQTLTLMGDGLTEDTGVSVQAGETLLTFSQTALTLNMNSSFGLGGGILSAAFLSDGEQAVWDWTGVTAFALTMSVAGTNPNMPFTLDFFGLFEDEATEVGQFTGTTEGLTSTPSLVTLNEVFRGDFSAVVGMTLTFDAEGSINTTINDITAVPEPSTWALLSLGGAICAGAVLRRRSKTKRA